MAELGKEAVVEEGEVVDKEEEKEKPPNDTVKEEKGAVEPAGSAGLAAIAVAKLPDPNSKTAAIVEYWDII